MITANQLDPIVQNAVGRPSTPFEQQTFSTASPQTLANLPSYYSGLNKDVSIVDYLKHTGQDPSETNRIALGSKYGINNIGTAEGNTALLKALQSGSTPAPTAPTSLPGTISSATPTYDPLKARTTDNSGNVPQTTPQPDTISGSIQNAATPPESPNQPPQLPEVSTAIQTYNDATATYKSKQSAVSDIDNQIADLRRTMSESLANKKAQIERNGGVVNSSQLAAEVAAENQPIQAQINGLLDNRAVLAKDQAMAQQDMNAARQAYTEAQNLQKESDTNFYKTQSANLAELKQADVESQNAIKNAQADTKIAISANKPINLPVTDAAGNVLGHTVVTWHNPGATIGITADGKTVSFKTDPATGTVSSTPLSTNTIPGVSSKTQLPLMTLASGATPQQVYQSLISGKDVPVKGSPGTPLSQQDLYNLAIADMMGSTSTAGGRTPSGAVTAVKDKETQIMNAYGLSPRDIVTEKSQFQALSKTNAALLQTASYNNLALNTANDNLTLAIQASADLPRGGAKFVNKWAQMANENFTPAVPLSQLETYIYTFGREYAKVTSGAAQSKAGLTNSASDEVSKLLSAAQSPETFAAVAASMQADMNNVITENNKAVNAFPDTVKKLYGWADTGTANQGSQAPSKLPPDIQTKVQTSLTFSPDGKTAYIPRDVWSTLGANMDDLLAEAKAEGFTLLVK